jgi:hypothetical protein
MLVYSKTSTSTKGKFQVLGPRLRSLVKVKVGRKNDEVYADYLAT